MMLCSEVKEILYEYIYEELDKAKSAEVLQHLKSCDDCRKAYDELKALLIDDVNYLSSTKNAIKMSEELPLRIEKKIRKRSPMRFSRFAAAACILLAIFYGMPVAAYYLIENTALNKYITFDNDLEKDMKEGKIQVVNKSSSLNGITFRVDGIIKGKDKTTILFTFKVPKNKDFEYAIPNSGDAVFTVEDQLGHKYHTMGSAITVKSANEDGEATAIVYVEPLKYWAYKLEVRVTSLQTGKLVPLSEEEIKKNYITEPDYKYKQQPAKNIYGKWEVSFYINRTMNVKETK